MNDVKQTSIYGHRVEPATLMIEPIADGGVKVFAYNSSAGMFGGLSHMEVRLPEENRKELIEALGGFTEQRSREADITEIMKIGNRLHDLAWRMFDLDTPMQNNEEKRKRDLIRSDVRTLANLLLGKGKAK